MQRRVLALQQQIGLLQAEYVPGIFVQFLFLFFLILIQMRMPSDGARARATVRPEVLDFGCQYRTRAPGRLETLLLAIHAREDAILRHPEAQQQMPAPWVTP